ncbi:hypothetical protein CO615_06885 [Lysobacteraceae bacterium NML75-0749]|nr:hypothetical protein CO615_06885 [Xanthomonadaceae bacterium NML75-0749]PJJ99649.1 hypothetical protein CO611_04025 [Xanthomonadaceae bacterium NML03-0222]PJK06360.1 hypothetical protein CO610_10300 [Xanthomonadaceae bacterium NML95-0200]PJK06432.1 hypothetical protein CO612_02295 [Xanthomonadaceae bacterium NML71-0210]
MRTTAYFRDNVLAKRTYLTLAMCNAVIMNPVKKVQQDDGRIRYWGFEPSLGKWLRVVTLEDGLTIHNAFPDRNFTP